MVQHKLSNVDERDIVNSNLETALTEMRTALDEVITQNKSEADEKFDDIFTNHLYMEEFIGKDEFCEYPSMIKMLHQKLPDM